MTMFMSVGCCIAEDGGYGDEEVLAVQWPGGGGKKRMAGRRNVLTVFGKKTH